MWCEMHNISAHKWKIYMWRVWTRCVSIFLLFVCLSLFVLVSCSWKSTFCCKAIRQQPYGLVNRARAMFAYNNKNWKGRKNEKKENTYRKNTKRCFCNVADKAQSKNAGNTVNTYIHISQLRNVAFQFSRTVFDSRESKITNTKSQATAQRRCGETKNGEKSCFVRFMPNWVSGYIWKIRFFECFYNAKKLIAFFFLPQSPDIYT